jgi:hypothetical protein
MTIPAGGVENFRFSSDAIPQKDDRRYVVVFERGNRIFKKQFCDLGEKKPQETQTT